MVECVWGLRVRCVEGFEVGFRVRGKVCRGDI